MTTFKRVIANDSGAVRTLISQYGSGGRLEHIRHIREDLQPQMDRVKALAQNGKPIMGMRYVGSVSRVVINDWLVKNGKNWRQFVLDKDLKAKFMTWYRSEFSKFSADTYRERPLSINRTRNPLRKPPGMSILDRYRKEMANAG